MSKILWCIEGETASGKDLVTRHLCDKYGMRVVCSYTTRPPRTCEINGREHWFVSDEEMQRILSEDKVVAYTKIEDKKSNAKGYEYCATLDNVNDADIYIIDPKGVAYMKEKFPDINIKVIFIYVSEEIRRQRALSRDSSQEKAFNDRVANEKAQFEDARINKNYDYMIINENKSEDELFAEIDKIIEDNK